MRLVVKFGIAYQTFVFACFGIDFAHIMREVVFAETRVIGKQLLNPLFLFDFRLALCRNRQRSKSLYAFTMLFPYPPRFFFFPCLCHFSLFCLLVRVSKRFAAC